MEDALEELPEEERARFFTGVVIGSIGMVVLAVVSPQEEVLDDPPTRLERSN